MFGMMIPIDEHHGIFQDQLNGMIEESMVKKSMVDFPLWLNAIFTTHDWEW